MDPESPLASSLLMRAMLFILTSCCDMDKLTCHGVPILECVLLDLQSLPLYLAGPNLRDGQFGIGKLKTAIAMSLEFDNHSYKLSTYRLIWLFSWMRRIIRVKFEALLNLNAAAHCSTVTLKDRAPSSLHKCCAACCI